MTSKLVVNTIEADTGISSVSFASSISMDSTSKFHFSAAGVDIGADTNINRPAAGVLGFNISGAEKLRIDTNGHLNTSGIASASNFKTGSSNLHSTGLTVGNNFLHSTGINVGTGATIHVPATNVLTLGTNSNERLRIDSSGHISQGGGATPSSTNGNVGLKFGIKSALNNVIIGETTNGSMNGIILESRITGRSGGARCSQVIMGDGVINFETAPSGGAVTERLRIDSSGRLMIGTTTPSSNSAAQVLTIANTTAQSANGNCGITIRSGTTGGQTNEGSIFFSDATSGAGEYAGYLQYSHASNYFRIGVNSDEKLRIDASGRTILNNAAVGSNEYLTLGPNGSTPCDMAFRLNNDNDSRIKYYDGGGTLRGQFGYTTYSNSTDYPNFHDSFYLQTDPSSNGTLATAMRINRDGCFIYPKQPCFSVAMNNDYESSTDHTADFDTERFDQGNNFNTGNATFTAPVTGKYYMHAAIQARSLGGTQNHIMGVSFWINGSVQTSKGSGDQYLGRDTTHYITVHCIRILNLAQGDTVTVRIQLHASVNVEGSGGSDRCNWQGYLMA